MRGKFALMFVLSMLWMLAVSSIFAASISSDENRSAVKFTQIEREWIAQNRIVILGAHKRWLPYDFVDDFGQYKGVVADILKVISKKSGLKFRIVPDKWVKSIEKVHSHQLDGLSAEVGSRESKKEFLLTKPYFETETVIVTQKNNDIYSIDDLSDKTVAVSRRGYAAKWIKKHYPSLKTIPLISSTAALKAVATGRADAYIGNEVTVKYLIGENRITNLKIAAKIDELKIEICIAVDKDKPILRSIFDKSISTLSPKTLDKIVHKWLQSSDANRVVLSVGEKAYIKKHPVISVGDGDSWAPIGFVEDGKYVGIAKDFLDLISQRTGLKFKMVIGDWGRFYEDMKADRNGSVDMLDTLQMTEDRLKYFNFTPPYITMQKYFFIRDDVEAKSLDDLSGKIIAIPKHWNEIDYIKKHYPKIKILETESFPEALDAVITKRADLLIDDYTVLEYTLERRGVFNIVPFKMAGNDTIDMMRMATKKRDKILASILTKGLNSIREDERRAIYTKWVKFNKPSIAKIRLDEMERKWIKEHPVLHFVADPQWAPIEFVDERGRYAGLVKDYLDIISDLTGLKFRLIKTRTWQESVTLVKSKKSDMFSCVISTPERKRYMYFSKPYLTFPYVVVTKIKKPFVENLKQLSGKNIVVIKDYAITDILISKYSDINFIFVKNIKEALEAVSKSKAYAFISLLPTATYNINKYGFTDLKIAGKLDSSVKLSFATRKELGVEAIDILNKALSHISDIDRERIKNKWLSIKLNERVDYTLLFVVMGVSALIILIILYWMHRLQAEIIRRKKIEKELKRAKQRAEEANRAKSIFLSNMSHEIRTPMNAVIGFTELLDEHLEDRKLKQYVKTIKNSGQTLLKLINDILDLSKIEAGKMEIQKHPVNLHKLLEEVASVFTLKVQEKGIDLVLEDDSNIPGSLLLDDVRIRQILLNLIGNAIKFTDRGYIKLKARALAIKDHRSKVDLEIDVEDTGIGIRVDQIEKIFGDFEQVSGQDNRKYGGTGLGLAISYRLAKMMGGELSVTSQDEKGSIFTLKLFDVYVSSITDESQERTQDDNKEIVFEKAKILVADDVEDNRELIVKNFEDRQVTVLTAEDGADAIEVFKKERPDLVLMDMRMPNIDGAQAAKEIKKIANVPIIALTASVMHDDYDGAKREIFDGFLRKPVLKKALFREIAHFLPYSKREIQTAKEDNILDKNAKEILHKNQKRLWSVYEEAKRTNSLRDIQKLSEEIKKLAVQEGSASLNKFADELLQAIGSFDIVTIEKIMGMLDTVWG